MQLYEMIISRAEEKAKDAPFARGHVFAYARGDDRSGSSPLDRLEAALFSARFLTFFAGELEDFS